jgi:hypothetical protein
MGLWSSIKNTLHKTIRKIKQFGSAVGHGISKGAKAAGKVIKSGANKAGKVIKSGASEAGGVIKTVYSDAKDFVEAPLKTINNLMTSPTFLIAVGIAAVGAIVILPQVIK